MKKNKSVEVLSKLECVRLNLFNHYLALLHAKFAYNSVFRNPVFR